MAKTSIYLWVALLGCLATGCAEDDKTADSDAPVLSFDDAVVPGESRLGELGIDAAAFEYADIEAPWETVEECYAFDDDAKRACACDNCTDIMRECDALEGCIEIRDCNRATGCSGPNECYLFPGAPCVDVIDRWSNSSVSAAVSLDLEECTVAAGC